jgi:putative ABC transport system ATP-binding protein
MISINNITKIYKKGTESFIALEDVSISIGNGEYTAITGSSGAGKSTLLYTIGGLIHPDSGTVLFRGENLYGKSEKFLNAYRKSHVGFVFQQFHLMPYLTVFENIRLNCHRKNSADKIRDYLEKCSIAELRNKFL